MSARRPAGDGVSGVSPTGGQVAGALDSWALVTAVQDGDREAFGELFTRYREVVRRYIAWRVGDRELAEDLTSETFVRALARIDSVHEQGRDVGAWLVTIARNLIYDHAKRAATRREVCWAELPDTEDSGADPQQLVLAALERDAIAVALTRLSADQRQCVRARFLGELSVAETAVEMGRAAGAVKGLRHRAVQALVPLLAPLVGEVA